MKLTKNLKFALRSLLMKCNEIATDKGVLVYEGDLIEGTEVFVEVEAEEGVEPTFVPAEDGAYTAEGKIITVADGKITEIKDEAEAEVPATEEVVEEVMEAEEPAEEPVETPEVEEVAEATIEERVASLEGKMAEIVGGLEAIMNAIAALETRIASAEEKLVKVEAEPATEPVAEEAEMTQHKMSYLRKK